MGDSIDDADLSRDLAHGRHRFLDRTPPLAGLAGRLVGDALGHSGMVRILRHSRRHLLQRGRRLLNAGGLLHRGLGERLGQGVDLFRGGSNRVGDVVHVGDDPA